jgi:RNA polymerase sigma-70 factor, ECF subfamily
MEECRPGMVSAPKSLFVQASAGALDVAEVHARHADFVWRTLQRLGVRPADLEDTLQDVFVVVHRRLGSYDGSSAMTTWLYSVCLRTVSAYRRRAHRRRENLCGQVPEQIAPAGDFDPEELLAGFRARQELERVLDGMDLEKRAVFVMFEIDGLSCSEIGEIVGIPVGTVYSRLDAARRQFEKSFKRWQARKTGGRS